MVVFLLLLHIDYIYIVCVSSRARVLLCYCSNLFRVFFAVVVTHHNIVCTENAHVHVRGGASMVDGRWLESVRKGRFGAN